ncbi:D123-domain-containing protein [Phakopsora pachyrhizi]|nr:D123-domain-containing protein [Phakopsora pachyrhizi]
MRNINGEDHRTDPVDDEEGIDRLCGDQLTELPGLDLRVLKACSFQSWFKDFRQHTIDSTVIELNQEFVKYLLDQSNGIHLPLDVEDLNSYESQLSDDSDVEDDPQSSKIDTDDEDEDRSFKVYKFPELSSQIRNALIDHGGSIFPKLNWSAPQDSKFLLPSGDGALRCKSVEDVYLLLKASDCIYHDLDLIQKSKTHEAGTSRDLSEERFKDERNDSIQPVLVLRRWSNLNPSNEFRCFVRDKKLIGISARCTTNHFEFLVIDETKRLVAGLISDFFELIIVENFILSDYIFDVYITNPINSKRLHKRKFFKKGLIKVIDFNPFASFIDPCLFDYHELNQLYHSSLTKRSKSNGSRCADEFYGASGNAKVEQQEDYDCASDEVLLKVVENSGFSYKNKFSSSQVPYELIKQQ